MFRDIRGTPAQRAARGQSMYEAAKRIAGGMVGLAEIDRIRMAARILGSKHGLNWRNVTDPNCDAYASSGMGCQSCGVLPGESCDHALTALALDSIAWVLDNAGAGRGAGRGMG